MGRLTWHSLAEEKTIKDKNDITEKYIL